MGRFLAGFDARFGDLWLNSDIFGAKWELVPCGLSEEWRQSEPIFVNIGIWFQLSSWRRLVSIMRAEESFLSPVKFQSRARWGEHPILPISKLRTAQQCMNLSKITFISNSPDRWVSSESSSVKYRPHKWPDKLYLNIEITFWEPHSIQRKWKDDMRCECLLCFMAKKLFVNAFEAFLQFPKRMKNQHLQISPWIEENSVQCINSIDCRLSHSFQVSSSASDASSLILEASLVSVTEALQHQHDSCRTNQ